MKRKRKVHKLLYALGSMEPVTACNLRVADYSPKLDTRLAWNDVTCKNCLCRKGKPIHEA